MVENVELFKSTWLSFPLWAW